MIGTDVSRAVTLLGNGELVGIPTETVYGLAANALDPDAIAKIYAVKNRPSFNPLILHIPGIKAVTKYASFIPELGYSLMRAFWPGSLSLLLPKKELVPDVVTAGSDKVVLRVPDHLLTLELLNNIDFPLAAPSANISNTVSPTSALHVEQGLGNQVSYILDGGNCTVGVESTIVEVVDNQIYVLRDGGVTREELEKFGKVSNFKHSEKIQSPGQLSKHYSTSKSLLMVENLERYIEEHSDKNYAVLLYEDRPIKGEKFVLSQNYHFAEIANNLFSAMREADKSDAEAILVEPIKEIGIGRAVADRLKRASIRDI